jgi:hypothetical protein
MRPKLAKEIVDSIPSRLSLALLFTLSPIHLYTMSEALSFKGSLAGHSNWVTAVATSSENPDMILTASRGGSF